MIKNQTLEKKVDKRYMKEIFFVSWEESERDWGSRPDGCSLHMTQDDAKQFIEKYWHGMPDSVPDEYSRPAGSPTLAYVTPRLYNEIKLKKPGVRIYQNRLGEIILKELYYGEKVDGWRIRE